MTTKLQFVPDVFVCLFINLFVFVLVIIFKTARVQYDAVVSDFSPVTRKGQILKY